MIKLTDEKIISILNQDSSFFSAVVSNLKYVVIIFIAITIVLLLIKKVRRYALVTIFVSVLFIISLIEYSNKYDYIKYSIKNNTWAVVTDTVVDKVRYTSTSRNGKIDVHYYIYLKDNGKVSVNLSTYCDNSIGDSAYVILLEDKNGKKQVSNKIFSMKNYVYNEK